MKKPTNDSSGLSLGDRFATAVISGICAGITLVAYFFMAHSWHTSWRPGLSFFQNVFSSNISLYIIGIAALLGFLLGADRMANIFGALWGANDSHK